MEQGPDMEMNEEVTVEVLVSGVSLQKSRNIQNNVSFKKSQAHQTNMQGEDKKQPANQYRPKGQETDGEYPGSEPGLQKKKEKSPS
ncbi:hypothetical protein DID88_009576 [Monilinia fructigena]|uniref:Uncharacterized protein n=1 Tax=Monilinia fructigena TaxID=38457 RepID=A0A395IML0_9HELO|nr:hypothetical protein DID88_009576 [Monilinia fructigena]